MRTAHLIVLLALLASSPTLAQSENGNPRVLQGPMLGTVTSAAATVWLRLSVREACVIEFDTDPSFTSPRRSEAVPQPDDDRTVRIHLRGLEPGTRYWYRVLVAGRQDPYLHGLQPFSFETAPASDQQTRFRVAFGSCARVAEDAEQPIWRAVRDAEPDLFCWLGDNIYGDSRDPEVLREEYRRQRGVPALQAVLRSVSNVAIWDDHDFALNNHDARNPVKAEALDVFGEYWANPASGLPDCPGVFFAHAYGGVDFFFLDCRYHRDPNTAKDGPGKTMLGAGQMAWLRAGLAASRAPFKILACGSGWSAAKGPGNDAWSAFLHERDALFDFIRDEAIGGVVLISGDTHVAELNCIPRSAVGGYDLYDLVSSPLAQRPTTSWRERHPEQRIRPVFAESANFGLLEFDLRGEPTLTFTVIGVDGRPGLAPLTLKAAELQNGVETWRSKTDPRLAGDGHAVPASAPRSGASTGRHP